MSLLPIVTLPDPLLKDVSQPIDSIDAAVETLIEDMFETMYAAPGIGLAAIQVGVARRVVVMDLAKKDDSPEPRVFINPEIIWRSEETSRYEEGCLSIPDYFGEVERPTRVKVRFLDRAGKRREIDADGLLATCLQHEIDHTNGVLFIDHLSRLKRERVTKKFAKAAKRSDDGDVPAQPSA